MALGASFPVVPTAALPPAVTPLPVVVVTTPGFEAMVDPADAFCNAPGKGKETLVIQLIAIPQDVNAGPDDLNITISRQFYCHLLFCLLIHSLRQHVFEQ